VRPSAWIRFDGPVGEFESLVATAAERTGCAVIVDLSGRDPVDSMMLASLVGADKTVRSAGGRLALVAPSPAAQRMLELTGLLGSFEIHESAESAAVSLQVT
jgi:anti-anti-sigma factor